MLSLLVFLSLPFGMSLAVASSSPWLVLPALLAPLLAPLPLLQVTAARGSSFLAWGWVTVCLAGAALVYPLPALALLALGYLLFVVWPAVSVELRLRRAWPDGRWMAILALVGLAIVVAALFGMASPQFPPQVLEEQVAADLRASPELQRAWETAVAQNRLAAQTLTIATYLAPSLSAAYLLAFGAYLRPRLPLLGLPIVTEEFCLFRSEEWLPVGFILGGLGWAVLPEPGKWLGANLLVTVAGLYFLHGLAIIHFYLGPRLRHNRWARAGVLLVALQVPVAAAVAVVGLADAFVRLRRSREPGEGSAS